MKIEKGKMTPGMRAALMLRIARKMKADPKIREIVEKSAERLKAKRKPEE